VHFGLQIPYAVPASRQDLLTWASRADLGPFRTLSIGERVTYDNPDQTVAITAAAAVTNRVRLLTNVSVLPIHSPALSAKAFATIDRLSEGRLILTPGVGSRPEDFAAAGSTYSRRWQRLDDTVASMRALWRLEPAEPSGTILGPPPFTPGGPSLHCAATGPKALARAVRWACGYQGFTTDGNAAAMATVATTVCGAFEDAGLPRPELGVSCFFALGDGSLERLREVVGKYYGFADPATRSAVTMSLNVASADAIATTVANADQAGFDEVHFLPTTTDPAEIDRLEVVLGRL
jgi:alkanesulfonate monooxygenase SsuD/methylene tetrahydromethanopterin reductase-like flavin-dependent oxidoreductase (luciferase family)